LKTEIQNTIQAFDGIAESYDVNVLSNEILVWMRNIVQEIYLLHFKPNEIVLELNAGTGTDALFLAEHGINVYATDASERMIERLRIRVNGIAAGKIHSEVLTFSEINKINEEFDGVVSNFGGLNCINDFEDLSNALNSKLRPGGKFIAVVMNKLCPWEMNYFLMKLNPRNAFRRLSKNGTDVRLNGKSVRTYYFKPKEFVRSFAKNFDLEKIYTLGLFTPPPYLSGIYQKFKQPVELLMKIDNILKGTFPFNRFGDHFVVVLRKKM
jgi:ubiquinone/menaquinone biosynthesis C-methylase UbiE